MNFINKHFRKSKCVKVIYFAEGKKHSIHYLIPKGNVVKIKEKAFILTDDHFFTDDKNFITYVFSYNRVEPIDPNDVKTLSEMSPSLLGTAINSNVASQILSATKSSTDINILLILILFVTVVGLGAVWYMLSNQLKEIYAILEPFRGVITP